jgi:hypothetical protein
MLNYVKFFIASAICAHLALLAVPSQASNITLEFDRSYALEGLSEDEVAKIQSYRVVFVAGLLAEAAEVIGFNYFEPQETFLDSLGIEHIEVTTSSREPEEVNSGRVIEFLQMLPDDKKIILFTHSRGGLIALRSLIEGSELRGRIAGWISLQAPFKGSLAVDNIFENGFINILAKGYVAVAGSNSEVLSELRTAKRFEYLVENSIEIQNILEQIPVITFGSQIEGAKPISLDYYIHPSRGFAFSPGTDGLVSPLASILSAGEKSSSFILKNNIAHRQTVLLNGKSEAEAGDAVHFSKTLFKLIMNL